MTDTAGVDERALVRAALAQLGIERLVFTIHDPSFPADATDDVGRGSPHAAGATRLYRFVAARGFDAIQLGPQGKTTLSNPSPYDAGVMARSHLSVALGPLVNGAQLAGLLPADLLDRAVAGTPAGAARRADHTHAWHAVQGALRVAFRHFAQRPARFAPLAAARDDFGVRNADWLIPDALYELLTDAHRTDDWRLWGPDRSSQTVLGQPAALLKAHPAEVDFNGFVQWLLHVQHTETRASLRTLGLDVWADFQVGLGPRDQWQHQALFLPGYALGAPPSRTTPLGQAWGYPVLDPGQFDHGGLAFFDRRLQRLLADFDGVRIDHPHGIVCPWVYRTDREGDPLQQVRQGARLYESPDLPEHPVLSRYAIATRDDLAPPDQAPPRYADDWVHRLSEAQITRYGQLLDRVMAAAAAFGVPSSNVCAEILSTCPFPLAQVMKRHGLGRLRVVQKADPDNPADPYRSATATAADWITLGTHDTAPIWSVIDDWHDSGRGREVAWANYLADRLAPTAAQRAPLAAQLQADRGNLVHAFGADLFLGPARRVNVFFADLFGLRDRYNVPGTVSDGNWTLRVPPNFEARYAQQRTTGEALDLTRALALALRARARGAAGEASDLAGALERVV